MMTTAQYITNIHSRYIRGNATEHTFRGDLQQLIESLVPTVSATNEPKRQSCGAPDYILTKKDMQSRSDSGIPVGFIEAKDIGDKDLDGTKKTGNKEQFDRYKASLNNLIFTDYLSFHLYRDGIFITKIAIGEITDKGIKPLTENFSTFENLIKDFCTHIGQTIKSSKKLAEMMAGKARLLSDVIGKALTSDEIKEENSTLKEQMVAFKQILIHDITAEGFADVYAQTIAYGMFAARLHDPTLPTFSRQEAAELIPKSNPFLRKLFGYIAGPDIDDRIKWIVDSLVDIFLACNVEELLKNYGKSTKMEDPIIHFYETFLSEYDPKLRKARGVWYTPAPVVNFIVRAVDDILKTEFDLPQGLADNSKTKIKVDVQGKKIEQEVHKVQILDPATGTGTFLAETIKHIYKKFEGQKGIWSNYVETHLLPRLNGFELLMASYAMAHLKLDLLLTETGYKPTTNQRFRVYLTNSLEEYHQDTGTLFANWLSTEANEANHIKRDTPVMCVIGNPPYSVSSTNKNEWIQNLISAYKKDLNERKINLDDDYIKFIRYGQHYIDKNGSGILAYISNNSFIDGITHRQMRKNLLESFDKIYILDLHGNAKKKEVCPDGSADQNVFDIMQGVSINIFVKSGNKKKSELGQVYHFNLQGKREFKYETLNSKNIQSLKWEKLEFTKPNYFFVPKNFDDIKTYEKGLKIDELYVVNNSGVSTDRDTLFLDENKIELEKRIKILLEGNYSSDFKRDFNVEDSSGYPLLKRISNKIYNVKFIQNYHYRPFDIRKIYFDETIISRPAKEVTKQTFKKDNLLLIVPRQVNEAFHHIFISKIICDSNITSSARLFGAGKLFPLYLYPETNGQLTIDQTAERTPNLNPEIVKQIAEKLGSTFTNEKETTKDTFAPIDILDYIYAVLHSPTYREKYKEFLKIDFPRVPYPKDKDTFWQLVKLGGEIRQIHLLESPTVEQYITQYPEDGDNIVTKPKYVDSKVYINDTQYFDNVPQIAWDFYIGGYQPAQKWLKDRKDRKLEFDDILHYQKIIVALAETDRLMKEIDKIHIE
ncbi:MAG TPA: N-6 DNA methylase [Saprospiraceae bacterium]|jgi:predicted helicase|nr:N-6 DNA methylase [Saprospiraceae bacterium]HQV65947.1 N-6 DNA methylase [Saprospiraceae bacterium]HRG39775.1 N-6 DNA methylase [Saprospiraceae bacterium]